MRWDRNPKPRGIRLATPGHRRSRGTLECSLCASLQFYAAEGSATRKRTRPVQAFPVLEYPAKTVRVLGLIVRPFCQLCCL
ncbi:uncharacterized protein TrAFT101_000774 [Trichoderma asperellum]|uniref:uncharacterized protein n=1 Tax=Trichoderma asperellum TaxID=101201 RepID=UPI0033294C75|nr:hypothetical protein TrAFT101_000774 [Trichoderma asperellum]